MKKILVVVNDAGASNFIASYFYFKNCLFDTILTGPAKKIFYDYKLKFHNHSKSQLKTIIPKYDIVYTGTGWQSNLEKEAIKFSKINKIKVITFLDHWSNYRSRFILNRNKILPDQIWVSNKKAKNMILNDSFFLKCETKIILNTYKKYLKLKYKQIKYKKKKITQVLFLAEPIEKKRSGFDICDIIQKLILVLQIKTKKKIQLNLRPHPTQSINDFLKFKNNYNNIEVKVSKNFNLLKDIKNNHFVIGCNSIALIVSLWFYKKTYYFFYHRSKNSFIKNNKLKNFWYAKI